MNMIRLFTGTLLFALLAFGCNSGDEPVHDAREQAPIELEDVRNDVDDPAGDTVIREAAPLEPKTPERGAAEETSGTQASAPANSDRQDRGQAADASEPQDRDSRAGEDRPVVTIPPEVINPDYKPLLNENNELIVSGRSVDELLELIGEPMSLLRQGQRGSGWHKEVWILPIYQEDSTGLYLYIQNGEVVDWRLDTFVGLQSHPQLLEWF